MVEPKFASREIFWAYHWQDEDERTLKTIGYFSDEAKARTAIESVKSQPGFRDCPDGFEISPQLIDVIGWSEGFESPWKL
jgi:homoserine kinase type II